MQFSVLHVPVIPRDKPYSGETTDVRAVKQLGACSSTSRDDFVSNRAISIYLQVSVERSIIIDAITLNRKAAIVSKEISTPRRNLIVTSDICMSRLVYFY